MFYFDTSEFASQTRSNDSGTTPGVLARLAKCTQFVLGSSFNLSGDTLTVVASDVGVCVKSILSKYRLNHMRGYIERGIALYVAGKFKIEPIKDWRWTCLIKCVGDILRGSEDDSHFLTPSMCFELFPKDVLVGCVLDSSIDVRQVYKALCEDLAISEDTFRDYP